MMTRRDYVQLAEAVRATVNDPTSFEGEEYLAGHLAACEALAQRLEGICKADNPRFDADRFRAACSA